MTSAEEVLKIAQKGDGYLAVERSSFVVRKLKRQKKINEASSFLFQLANTLLDLQKVVPSTVAAQRGIEVLNSIDNSTISDEIKQIILKYIDRLQTDHSCPDLFTFFDNAINLLGDDDLIIIRKEAFIADQSNNFNMAQTIYIRMIKKVLQKDEDTTELISALDNILWRWIISIKDGKKRLYTGQFILTRCALAISAQNEKGLELALHYVDSLKEKHPDQNFVLSQPLLTFAHYFLKALSLNSPQSVYYLMNSYKKIIEVDRELNKWVIKNKEVHFNSGLNINNLRQSLSGISDLFQSLFGGSNNQ